MSREPADGFRYPEFGFARAVPPQIDEGQAKVVAMVEHCGGEGAGLERGGKFGVG